MTSKHAWFLVVVLTCLSLLGTFGCAKPTEENAQPGQSTEEPAVSEAPTEPAQAVEPQAPAESEAPTEPEQTASAPDSATLETPLPDAPPKPDGYADDAGVVAALSSGEVALVNANPDVPPTVKETKDIPYGNEDSDHSLLLDLYEPSGVDEPVPAIIFIHGGGWGGGKKEDLKLYAVHYAEEGYVTATIRYRLSGEAKFPAQVEDCKQAVRWMRANAADMGVDPDRIAVSGNSAGGHLAMMVGYTDDPPDAEVSSRVCAVVDFYGPTDLTPAEFHQRSEPNGLIGHSYEERPDLWEQASPLHHLTADDPPTLIFHGTIDSLVPVSQADLLATKLKELRIPYLYDQYEGWPHVMDLAKPVNERCLFYMDSFFDHYLRGKVPPVDESREGAAGPHANTGDPEFDAMILADAPPLPAGYDTPKELQAAVKEGKHRLLGPEDLHIPDTIESKPDVEYGRVGDQPLLLDLWKPKSIGEPVPGLIFIHGGGWKVKGKGFYTYWTAHHAAQGYVCATIEYRIAEEATFPGAVSDAKCAVRWMRANAEELGVDPNQIAVIGQSAGAHLALMAAYTPEIAELEGTGGHEGVSSAVQLAVSYYAPTDLTAPALAQKDIVQNFMGAPYEEAREQYELASPLFHVDADDPPTLIFHGTIDGIVPIEQADALADALAAAGVPYVYDREQGWDHAMDVFTDVNKRCMWITEQFLAKYMPLPQ